MSNCLECGNAIDITQNLCNQLTNLLAEALNSFDLIEFGVCDQNLINFLKQELCLKQQIIETICYFESILPTPSYMDAVDRLQATLDSTVSSISSIANQITTMLTQAANLQSVVDECLNQSEDMKQAIQEIASRLTDLETAVSNLNLNNTVRIATLYNATLVPNVNDGTTQITLTNLSQDGGPQ